MDGDQPPGLDRAGGRSPAPVQSALEGADHGRSAAARPHLRGCPVGAVLFSRTLRRTAFCGLGKDNNTRIIVVELADKTVGFLVDSVQEVNRVETAVIEPPPERVKRVATRYITGVARLEDRLLTLLDLDRVLTTDEQEALAL